MKARCLMVLGTSSGAGKSWLATALARWYANAGFKVAPFKAQNMSNNARVVRLPDGGFGEIGSAQYFQAMAARAVPDARMNPVLLKPEADTRSQVVVHGRVRPELAAMPWRERSAMLWPEALQALQSLREDHELVVIEGAGSPAEINLAESDYVNTRTALAAEASCLLVADIDRGGAFAHLYGTHSLMDERVRGQVRGFVLNKFRGDPGLLAPAPQRLQELTGVPTLAVVPMLHEHGLPEEDGFLHAPAGSAEPRLARPVVAGIALPHLSNLDEFQPLQDSEAVRWLWARNPAQAREADWLVLPGSKNSRADLRWLRDQGLDGAIEAHVAEGKPLLGICGGLQMLGRTLDDPQGIEGGRPGGSRGLGLLPLHTRFLPDKRVAPAQRRFGRLHGPWAALSGLEVEGYEIRCGRSFAEADGGTSEVLAEGLGWQRGPVLAVYLHGLFENPQVVQALFSAGCGRLDEAFERLAGCVGEAFGEKALRDLP